MADDDATLRIISCKEARSHGLKRYFTGKPCPRGHVCERYVSNTDCIRCTGNDKLLWHAENREKALKQMRVRYYANREQELEKARIYYIQNQERLREKVSKWRRDNPELAKQVLRRFYAANREKMNEWNRQWYEANWDKKREYRNRRRARKLASAGSHTAEDLAEIFRAQGGKCAYCTSVLGKRFRHVDHIVPLSKGGTDDRKNLQFLCGRCNNKKYNHDPLYYARTLGLLL
jgi:5-methylcytosine-specific restriction endonuclease McrA